MPAAQENEQDRRSRTGVFELMEKVRMPALWICVIIMGGFGVLSLFGDLFAKQGDVPEEELGTFEVPGGEKVTLTNKVFYTESQEIVPRLHRMFGGRANVDDAQIGSQLLKVTVRDEEELAWAWFMLREAAKAAGILVTDDVIVNARNKSGMETTLREYQRREPEETRRLLRDLTAISKFRNAIDKAQAEATWDKLFERFKATFEDLRASFVLFDTQKTEVAFDPKNNPEDRKKLEAWLTENPNVRSQRRIPEELDAQVLYARFKDETTQKLKEQYDARWAPLVKELNLEVSDEKLRQRFDIFKSAYDVPLRLASDEFERGLASRPDSRAVVDRPTEFEMVKDRLRIEYLVTRLVEKAFEEVSRAEKPLSFEDAMQKYGLRLAEISHLDSKSIQTHPDFASFRATAILQELRQKGMKPGDVYKYQGDPSLASGAIEETGGSVAIWRPTAYHAEREATLDDPGAMDFFVDEYKKKRRQDLAKEEAEAFRKAVEERVTAAVAPKVTELEAAMQAEIERQITEAKLDRQNPEHKPLILAIENDERQKKDAKLDQERSQVEPNMFLAVANERFLTVHDTGWIAKTTNRNSTFQPSEKLTTSEKAEQFFRKTQRRLALAGLKPGRMGQVETETNWYAAAVPLLLEKREPKPEDLYKLSKQQLDQLKGQVNPRVNSTQFWSYENFKRPEWFNLNVPSLEKGIEARRLTDQKKAEQERLRAENKRKQARAKSEKLAQDAMQSRPLFSGEDW
jgi:hypothetical protein